MMLRFHHSYRLRSAGFSLVELMVGIVVAMAAVIVVMQVFKSSEGQRRATTGGDDAQTTGAIALSLIQRDLRQAGQGVFSTSLLGCKLNLDATHSLASIGPVVINPAAIPAGDADTDVLQIVYGAGSSSPDGSLVGLQTAPNIYALPGSKGFRSGDRVIIAPLAQASPCELQLTRISAESTVSSITVQTGVAGAVGSVVFNLGATPRVVAYAIRSSRLTVCDFMTQDCTNADAANWTEVADNIVSLRADYGIDSTAVRDAVTDGYERAIPTSSPNTWCNLSRVVGMRLAIVARSRQPETSDITASAPTWAGAASAAISPPGADWQKYRYRTFETTVPLRNIPGAAESAFSSC